MLKDGNVRKVPYKMGHLQYRRSDFMARPTSSDREKLSIRREFMTADEFAVQFQGSSRVLWLVAVSVSGSRSLADDVLQESAIVALKKLDQYRPGTNFTGWMSSVVRFVALNQARKERRRQHSSLEGTPRGRFSLLFFLGIYARLTGENLNLP